MIQTSIENLLTPIQLWFNYSLWQKLSKEEKKFSFIMKQHLKASDKCSRELKTCKGSIMKQWKSLLGFLDKGLGRNTVSFVCVCDDLNINRKLTGVNTNVL